MEAYSPFTPSFLFDASGLLVLHQKSLCMHILPITVNIIIDIILRFS